MALVEMYEHEEFNRGPVANDINGLVIHTDISIASFKNIVVNGSTIRAWQNQVELPAGSVVDFDEKLSSYKVNMRSDREWQEHTVKFCAQPSYIGDSLTVPPLEVDSLNPSFLGGLWGNPRFNDVCSSILIDGVKFQ